VARYAGLTGSPDESGAKRREQGLAEPATPGSAVGMIQLAWRFLRFQKESALARWYQARTADQPSRHAQDDDCRAGTQAAHRALALCHHRRDIGGRHLASGRLKALGELTYSALRARIQRVLPIDDPRWREPARDMAQMPTERMGPAARSFAADAHDCIMVRIRTDLPNTSLWREDAPQWRAPLGSLRRHSPVVVRRRSFAETPSRCSSSLRVLRRQGAAKHKRR